MIERSKLSQPALSKKREMRREGERAKPRVRADVACRFFAADMLLARRHGQHEPSPPILVNGLAAQPARHLADKFSAAGEKPQIRAAEVEAVPNGLALRHHDIGPHRARRFQRAERDSL